MATYVIGDLQGCLTPLVQLLEQINYHPEQDKLWFAGDLINRGEESLETLRFIKSLGNNATVVLGNHDLHLLAVSHGYGKLKRGDTLAEILTAGDRDDLMDWLRHQPLFHYDEQLNTVMTHAGIPPCWDLQKAQTLAKEVEDKLKSDSVDEFFATMYGNKPNTWSDDLTGLDRLRAITNYLTRMRFCDENSKLDLESKEGINTATKGYAPWFNYPTKVPEDCHIVFGHWAALEGKTQKERIHALDTGCVWGGSLTALRLEDQQRFSTPCSINRKNP
ncbi:symmetrical bis(5'-nucleosyl)-tetraphosphatase [Marinomonas sp.]|uniref:Bis(5'-nucleosyl)-tetraphosphatase, symmetrical n=1 Tax=Marinomonas sp. (strain MWYL1) TaxID=400668 RepID=APAH_MARMS|nr:RecName: Full=Bis(5'-nucleosyl)-tetraphosphatase, symmetrical; AltName: Full=Ap4A hydrolase; AltName: Full=Diadenosine 5',5'''-P1,P4-tetraphosphate pyrophosphohydrolase; AltName: Full=Diadenosine tetraphosphatase [Marinomonas sp. MWYL1]